MDDKTYCPVCGAYIDLEDVDVNNNTEDGYGDMLVPHTCHNCGAELTAHFDAQDGYNFKYFEG